MMKAGYDWKRTVWKGLRPALVAALLGALVGGAQAISAETLVELGVPTAIAFALVEAFRNWAKQVSMAGDR